MISRKHFIASLAVSVLMIIASLVCSTSAPTLDAEEMERLTASLASCSCAVFNVLCTACVRSGDTYSTCTEMTDHDACTGDGARAEDLCGCAAYEIDCGNYEDCGYDEECLDCEQGDPPDACWGCSLIEEGSYSCGE